MIYAIGLGSNLNSRYGTQYQTLKKTINFIKFCAHIYIISQESNYLKF